MKIDFFIYSMQRPLNTVNHIMYKIRTFVKHANYQCIEYELNDIHISKYIYKIISDENVEIWSKNTCTCVTENGITIDYNNKSYHYDDKLTISNGINTIEIIDNCIRITPFYNNKITFIAMKSGVFTF